MRLTLLILLPAVSSLVLLSPWLLNIFGAAYATSAQSLVTLLALSAFPYTLNLFVITAYRLGQNLKELAWIPGIITGLCLVLIVPCSMRWGLIGVGIGWLIGQALGSAVALFYFLRSNSAAKRHEGLEVMQ
jgi:O-antigen/teichoic acid export membrane protein